ncbi:MAG: metallophosphoesterase, partial [Clostridia bacterium]|nr:metallophosphoesterase [Clostridia bacterium]
MRKRLLAFGAVVCALALLVGCFAAGADRAAAERGGIGVMRIDESGDGGYAWMDTETEEPLLTLDLLSDTHIGKKKAEPIVRACIERLEAEKDAADGVIFAGDLTSGGTEERFQIFYSLLELYTGDHVVIANGNHDYGQFKDSAEHREIALRYRNAYLGLETEKDYYSTEIKGCKIVVMGDEGEKANSAEISDEQLEFLAQEVAAGAVDGKPVIVVCHWPMRKTHGEQLSWPILPGGALTTETTRKVQEILQSYDNVIFISGHLHAGLNGHLSRKLFKACCVERHAGITCINAPGCGKGNHFGHSGKGCGMHLTIWSDKILVQGRNYETGEWLEKYVYLVGLHPETDDDGPVAP